MHSTRSHLRGTHSHGESQPLHAEASISKLPSKSHEEDEAFESLSTAALPISYTIKLATIADDAVLRRGTQELEDYVRGQEFLSDGIRRVGDNEGILSEPVTSRPRKRRRLGEIGLSQKREVGTDKSVLWRTASLRHACSCKSVRDEGTGTAQLIC